MVRRYLDSLPAGKTGWLAGLRDPSVGRALAMLHARPAHNWTLDELAHDCAADGVYEFLLSATPEPFVGAVEVVGAGQPVAHAGQVLQEPHHLRVLEAFLGDRGGGRCQQKRLSSELKFHRIILPDRRLIVAARFQAADRPQSGERGGNRWRAPQGHSPSNINVIRRSS